MHTTITDSHSSSPSRPSPTSANYARRRYHHSRYRRRYHRHNHQRRYLYRRTRPLIAVGRLEFRAGAGLAVLVAGLARGDGAELAEFRALGALRVLLVVVAVVIGVKLKGCGVCVCVCVC